MNGPFACPCCNCLTLAESPPGTFAICPVCLWEDDPVQFHNHASAGGANPVNLDDARRNFEAFGACDESMRPVVRAPTDDELVGRHAVTAREFMASRGTPVTGTNERALGREDALAFVRLCLQARTPILGGDVYVVHDGELEPAHANWYADRGADESAAAYLERSCDHARKYMADFPKIRGRDPVFVVVAMAGVRGPGSEIGECE